MFSHAHAYHLVTNPIGDLLADKLVHPVVLLVVGITRGHEAWDYERHGGVGRFGMLVSTGF